MAAEKGMGDVWKWATALLGGVVVTGISAWLAFANNAVSREEMVQYVQEQAPWTHARGEVLSEIQHNTQGITALTQDVKQLVVSQYELLAEQKVLVTRVSELLDKK
ncbi:MAG: hypothetical protein AAF581_15935 [Planctomycetota bacterium]